MNHDLLQAQLVSALNTIVTLPADHQSNELFDNVARAISANRQLAYYSRERASCQATPTDTCMKNPSPLS